MEKLMLLVGLTGLQGAGKTLAHDIARSFGFEIIDTEQLIHSILKRNKLPPTYENIHAYFQTSTSECRQQLRAQLVESLQNLYNQGIDRVLIDAVYHKDTISIIRSSVPCKYYTLAIYAPPSIRQYRIEQRKRIDDNVSDFDAKDQWMLSLGIGETFTLANFLVKNIGTFEEYCQELIQTFQLLLEEVDNVTR